MHTIATIYCYILYPLNLAMFSTEKPHTTLYTAVVRERFSEHVVNYSLSQPIHNRLQTDNTVNFPYCVNNFQTYKDVNNNACQLLSRNTTIETL